MASTRRLAERAGSIPAPRSTFEELIDLMADVAARDFLAGARVLTEETERPKEEPEDAA